MNDPASEVAALLASKSRVAQGARARGPAGARKPGALCFCGLNDWAGDGPAEEVRLPVNHGRSYRTLYGYREACQTCGEAALVDDDGEPLHFYGTVGA